MSRAARTQGDRARLVAMRAVYRTRGAHRTRGDTAYLVYVSVLVAAIAGVPIVRTVILALATPVAASALAHAGAAHVVAVLGALIWLGALALGRTRGPIAPEPFVAATLGRSEIPPRSAWARDLLVSAFGVCAALAALATLTVSGFLARAEAVDVSIAFIVGSALFALPTTAVWLAGQVLSRRGAAALGVVLAALLAVAAFVPPALPVLPASAIAALWPGAPGVTGAALAVLTLFAAIAVVASAVLVERISPMTVEEHAHRWEAMTVLAATGDVSGALDRTRARPTAGRRVRIPFTPPLLFAMLQRATVGLLRTPMRTVVAVTALAMGGAGWAWFAQLQVGPRWVLAIGAGLLTFAALGAFIDGFREAADTAGRPAVYGRTAGRMLLLHLPLPLIAGAVVPSVSALIFGGGLEIAAIAAAIGAVLVVVRAYDSTKGPMPIELMMPVPTPAGDASSIGVWVWQADALLWTAALSFWLSTATTAGPALLLWVVPAVALLSALTAGRLRRAAS